MKRSPAQVYINYREIITYIIAGVMTTAVNLFLFYGSTWTILDSENVFQLQAATIISWGGSVIFAYVINRILVFRCRKKQIIKEMASFVSGRVFTLFLDMAVMYIGVSILGIDHSVGKLLSMGLVTAANYIISKFFVFKNNRTV